MACRDCTRKGGCVYTTFWLVRFLPVVLVTIATAFGVYAYTYEVCILSVHSWPQRILYLFIFYALLILYYTSYLRTIYTKAWKPPQRFFIEGAAKSTYETVRDDERQLQAFLSDVVRERDLALRVRGFDQGIRFCDKCCCIKPDRSHHCSMCEQCVLKFDHHCPWVNNCVNFGNYKYFILFLAYGFIFCLWTGFTTLPVFIDFWRYEYSLNQKQYDEIDSFIQRNLRHLHAVLSNARFPIVFLLFLSCMFSLSLSVLFFYHLYLTAKNRTTVESFRAPMIDGKYVKDAFNHGIRANYREIFGSNPFYWFLPVASSRGDGVTFKVNDVIASAASGGAVLVEMGRIPAVTSSEGEDVRQRNESTSQDHVDRNSDKDEEEKRTTTTSMSEEERQMHGSVMV